MIPGPLLLLILLVICVDAVKHFHINIQLKKLKGQPKHRTNGLLSFALSISVIIMANIC